MPLAILIFFHEAVPESGLLDIEFNNATFKFSRIKINPQFSEFHKTYW